MTRPEALEIARIECQKRQLPWKLPCVARWGLLSYTVWTNSGCRGGNIVIKVRTRDGAILSLVQFTK
jgi:hypothetical protein